MSDAPSSLLHDAPLRAATTRHEEMMVEARRIVDSGNDRGLGYLENTTVITATLSSQRQYFKRAHSVESHAHMHKRAHFAPPVTGPPPLDHVDVFLDWMKMDHEIDFRDRLDINTYAIDPADLFLSKLQIQKLNEKDAHVADTCARDWGLYIDVMTNIDKVLDHLAGYDLSPREVARIGRTLELAQDMMTEHTKSLRWRLRARIGKRLRWYNEIEEQFAGRSDDDVIGPLGEAG